MPSINTKSERDLIGIDTFERGIVWSFLVMYFNATDTQKQIDTNIVNGILYNVSESNDGNADLNISVNLPYNNRLASELGGNILESLLHISVFSFDNILINCPASDPAFVPIDIEPVYVNTYEKYFTWTLQTVKSRLLDNDDNNANRISIRFFNDAPNFPSLRLQARIPIDYGKYLNTNNLVCSVKKLIDTTTTPSSGTGNNSIMGNDSVLGNGGAASNSGNNSALGNNSTLGN